MRVAIYDRVEPAIPTQLPLRLVQTCSQRAAAVLLVVAVPVVAAIAVASLMLIFQAAYAPAVRAILAQHPALGLEILAAIAVWLYLLGLPLRRLFYRLTLARAVEVDERTVTVTEGGRFRTRTWSAPLGSYTGLAHHLRASLSGTRHELILVHPEKHKSVLLSLGRSMPQEEVDRVAQMLGQKEICSGALYRFRPRSKAPARPTLHHGATSEALAART
jgi:hypothetical protein